MINLEKFSEEVKVVVPIVKGWGQYEGRKIYSPKTDDGWYLILLGDKIKVERKATPLEVEKALAPLKKLQVLSLGTEGVPLNFDNFLKRGWGETKEIFFLNLPIFSVANVVEWEDGRVYFYEQIIPKKHSVIKEVQEAFKIGETIREIAGVTPELRYYYLLANLQQQSYEAVKAFENFSENSAISPAERDKRIKEFRDTFAIRLERTIDLAGGILRKFSKRGNNYLVEWEVGDQLVKSTIRDNLQIVSAGFCLSGEDRKHTLTSLINLAQVFQEDYPLYITRE